MYDFKHALVLGTDATTDLPAFGFNINDFFIIDPTIAECGRCGVDPVETYGVSVEEAQALIDLNTALNEGGEAMLNEGCARAQLTLGIDAGDVAGMYFSGSDNRKPIYYSLALYMAHELQLAGQRVTVPTP